MRAILLIPLVALLLSGCTQPEESRLEEEHQAYVQKLIPPNKDAAARHFIDLIRMGDIGHAQQMAGAPLQGEGAIPALRYLHDTIRQGELLQVLPIGYQKRDINYGQQEIHLDDFTYQLHVDGRWYYAEVALDSSQNSNAVLGFHITWFNGFESMVAFNRFAFVGRTWRDWSALFLSIFIPIFIIAATAICGFSPVGRKWLWIVFILIGVVQFRYDWTHAVVDVKPLSLLLLGAGYQRENVYSPLILQWALPVGAFIFLICRRKLIEARTREDRKPPKKKRSSRAN
jgi:hypothetical protein